MIFESTDHIWKKDSEEMTAMEQTRVLNILKNYFSDWMQEQHPELENEKVCIGKDVIRKIEKKIRNSTVPFLPDQLTKLLVEIAENECKLAIPTEKNLKNNIGLSRKAFKNQLTALQNGDDALIEKVYLTHFEKCVRFLIRQCGSSFDHAHEASLDALLEIRQDLIKDKIFYGNLAYYFTARAKVKLFRLKARSKNLPEGRYTSLEDVDLQDDETIERDIHENEMKLLIAEAINKLCSNCKEILKQYYYEDMTLKKIAIKMRKSHDAVRQEARRCRNKLRTYLGESFSR